MIGTLDMLDVQSIGFTAPLASSSDSKGSGQMPFFTPNSEAPPNVLDQVEPEGEPDLNYPSTYND